MKEELLNDIGKRLPYRESKEYLDNLVDNAIENAIKHHTRSRRRKHQGLLLASIAASALLIIGIGITFMHRWNNTSTITTVDGGIDEFLNTLSDEEAAQLTYYEVEEIPEY